MLNLIVKLLITSIAAYGISNVLQPNVSFLNLKAAFIFALVFGLLNTFLKPVLKFFSFPITILTLGLFLLVINALIIVIADKLMDSFQVSSFYYAFIFSIALSLVTWLLEKLFVKGEED